MVDSTTLNLWKSYKYYDPKPVLKRVRAIEEVTDLSALPPEIRNLRTNSLKEARESLAAARFAYGMGIRMGRVVAVSPVEDADYDFMTMWTDEDTTHYCPVQLKELVPDELNPDVTLSDLFDKIRRTYPRPTNTVGVIYLNRAGRLNLADVEVPELPLRELYFLGAIEPDQSRWVLVGDMFDGPYATEFDHPVAAEKAL